MAEKIDELSNKEKKLLKILGENKKIDAETLAGLTTNLAISHNPTRKACENPLPKDKTTAILSDFSVLNESNQKIFENLQKLNAPTLKAIENLQKLNAPTLKAMENFQKLNAPILKAMENIRKNHLKSSIPDIKLDLENIISTVDTQELTKTLNDLSVSQKMITDFWVQQAHLLEEKKIAKVERIQTSHYTLTDEGKEYLNNGLPERQLLNRFDEKIDIKQLKKFDLSNVGIGWLRKKGWVTVKDGIIYKLNENPPVGTDETVLKQINDGDSIFDKDTVIGLIKRGLVKDEPTVKNVLSLQDHYQNETFEELDIESQNKIGTLTRKQIISGAWKNANLRRYDVTKLPKKAYAGKIHPYQRIIGEMREILLEMGFTELYGGIVQQSFWNFDALFQPQDHPAREMQDTFYLKETLPLPKGYEKVKAMHISGGDTSSTGWGGVWKEEKAEQCVLRTHTTSLSIQYLARNPNPPVKAFAVGRVYRRETIDTTHLAEFEQLEGIVMDENVTFGNLLGILREFYNRMGFESVRFKPSFYPYTEPSLDAEVYVDGIGWIEMGGAGVFREEVTAPLGVKYPVLAWGLGVSRIAMLRLGLKDLRLLHKSDVAFLRETPSLREIKGGI